MEGIMLKNWFRSGKLEQLESKLKQRDEVTYCIEKLGKIKDKRAVEILIPMLEDKIFADNAAKALAAIGDKQALPYLADALFNSRTSGYEIDREYTVYTRWLEIAHAINKIGGDMSIVKPVLKKLQGIKPHLAYFDYRYPDYRSSYSHSPSINWHIVPLIEVLADILCSTGWSPENDDFVESVFQIRKGNWAAVIKKGEAALCGLYRFLYSPDINQAKTAINAAAEIGGKLAYSMLAECFIKYCDQTSIKDFDQTSIKEVNALILSEISNVGNISIIGKESEDISIYDALTSQGLSNSSANDALLELLLEQGGKDTIKHILSTVPRAFNIVKNPAAIETLLEYAKDINKSKDAVRALERIVETKGGKMTKDQLMLLSNLVDVKYLISTEIYIEDYSTDEKGIRYHTSTVDLTRLHVLADNYLEQLR
jgi:hypothetical protein